VRKQALKGSDRSAPRRARRRARLLFDFKQPINTPEIIALGIAIWLIFFGLWELAHFTGWAPPALLPPPQTVVLALYDLIAHENFLYDIAVSTYRIVASFALACAVGVPLGILMGSFSRVAAFFDPLVSAWRYLPAPSFIPLLLMWLGTGDVEKLALLFIGVVWFLITLVMDHTRNVPGELIDTARTLGASRLQILWTVVIPSVMPNIVVTMRQMMAASWTYLTIAEITAATVGIGAMMMRAKRFIHVDQIMAGILVIGILGLLFDYAFRVAQKGLFPYDSEGQSPS